ncbi:hypothetical protein VP01_533g5 [Puccinia sorghi]|uniref:Uncharacterized protein n=1 Tax=Puccinia sorghi TaxID=27349 RepID=A0A0L6UKW9_9BASI|nr:hypothetical protein VP01_533g5 [Puccinia sorghi]
MSTSNNSGGHPVMNSEPGRARRSQFYWFPVVVVLMASVLYTYRRGGAEQPPASYIISGSFTTSSLYVLRYEHESRKLEVVQSVAGYGPHQYLHLDRHRRRLYATSWQEPARLSAWDIHTDRPGMPPRLTLINQAPINNSNTAAVSSYITSKHSLLFSVGGPTGEIHRLNPDTGAIEQKLQELLFVPNEALRHEDKSRKALVQLFSQPLDAEKKALEFVSEIKSVRADDGPRHAVVSADGERLYVVTEHIDLSMGARIASRVDLYDVTRVGLQYRASSSVIEEPEEHDKYRGDTIRMVPQSCLDGESAEEREYIVATTRGATPSQPGHLAVMKYDFKSRTLTNLLRWQTPTSGGKANAIELRPPLHLANNIFQLVLTDDLLGWISVLECNLSTPKIHLLSRCLIAHQNFGASHAVWI